MSVTTELERLQTARNTIRTKLVELGLSVSTDTLDTLADDVESIENRGAVSANVKEGETYTIPKGYHNGSGTVSGVAGGGNYTLQSKIATPTKKQQNIVPDSGYYGLSDVTVEAIPANYQDVSSVNAVAGEVLANKVFVTAQGTVTTGTMPNNGAASKTLDTTTTAYAIPAGYHNGSGTVKIVTDTETVTPTKAKQTVTPDTGKVLMSVTVNPIPAAYITTSDADAIASEILDGKFAYVDGVKVEGTMPRLGAVSETIDTTTISYTVPKGFHNGTGTVSIKPESKTATPSTATQNITPTSGYVLSKVVVNPIPSAYIVTTDATAAAGNILSGKTAYVNGKKVTGTMANNGAISEAIDGMTTTSVTIAAGYTSGGTVSLTTDIEEALAAI